MKRWAKKLKSKKKKKKNWKAVNDRRASDGVMDWVATG